MARKNTATSWLDTVAALLSGAQKRYPQRRVRRLSAERLESRMVLSGAPEPVDAVDSGLSLEEYLAQEHEMGPIAHAEIAAPPDQATPSDPEVPSQGADYFFGEDQPEGEDEGGGGSQGSGSGGGEGEGSGSGSGSGGGEGEGSGWGSGSGSGGPPEEPVIEEPQIEMDEGILTVSGQVTDDDDLGELTMTLEGGEGTVTLNSDGTFSVQITDPLGNNQFSITATDGNGNSTTYSFEYNF